MTLPSSPPVMMRSPSLAAATTGAPAANRRVRSTTDGIFARASVMRRPELRHAALKTRPDLLLRQVATDEDEAACALLAFVPRSLVVAVENHVHALKDESL